MSVRRQTANRLTLFRTCGTCGKQIVTTADTPWVRQVERDGKRQATTYFCSEGCFAASYKHIGWFDGKAEERRKLKDRNRDPEKERARNRAYQQAHREELEPVRGDTEGGTASMAMVIAQTERDTYKRMYESLLARMTMERESFKGVSD